MLFPKNLQESKQPGVPDKKLKIKLPLKKDAAYSYNVVKYYQGIIAMPIPQTCHDGICDELEVALNDRHIGIIKHRKSGWKPDGAKDEKLINLIGKAIEATWQ